MKGTGKKNQIMITALAIMIAVAGYLQFAGDKLDDEQLAAAGSDSVTSDLSDTALNEEDYVINEQLDGVLEEADMAAMDISEEDLEQAEAAGTDSVEQAQLTDIDSLDSDVEEVADNYLENDMEAVVSDEVTGTEAPGEAVFTSGTGMASLSDAKLLKEQTRAKNKEMLLEIINNTNLSDEQKQDAVNSMIAMTDIAEKETAAEILLEAKGFQDVVVSISEEGVDVVVNSTELTDASRAQIEDIVKRKTGVEGENIVISPVAVN